jgi:hypothetical protein
MRVQYWRIQHYTLLGYLQWMYGLHGWNALCFHVLSSQRHDAVALCVNIRSVKVLNVHQRIQGSVDPSTDQYQHRSALP